MKKRDIILAISAVFMILMSGVGIMYVNGNEVSGEDTFYMVSHSEYWSGEDGQVIARLYDWQGSPITVTNCTVDIYYPNKSPFISGALTDDTLQVSTGTHWYLFTVPDTEGVYQYMVTCNYPNNKVRSVASTFHVSPALNKIKVINSTIEYFGAQELLHYNNVQVNLSNIYNGVVTANNGISTIILNLTDIDTETDYIRDNMVLNTNFATNMTYIQDNQNTIISQGNNILNNLTAIENFCGDAVTSGSQLCLWVDSIQAKVTDINNSMGQYTLVLSEINATTHSTYDYITGALASNINTIIGTTNRIEANTVQINNTVNNIQSNTLVINTTTTDILANQKDEVYMEVTS